MKSLAKRLADQVASIPSTSPILLSGDWGAGKTTLLWAIEREIAKDADGSGIPRTVCFEAWRYETSGLLLPSLMRAIWERLPEPNRPEPALRAKLWHWAVVSSVGIAGTLARAAGGAALPVVEALLALRQDKKEGGLAPHLEPPEDDATLALQKNFQQLIRLRWKSERPLVVLIDDLDRCSPSGAVLLLDSIRHLVHQATPFNGEEVDLPCRFLVALDRKVISEAVTRKFAKIGSYDGNRYLKKLFPIAFDLPQPTESEVHRFVGLVLDPSVVSQSQAPVPVQPLGDADRDALDALTTALSDPLFANPRLIKRCINKLRLVLAFEEETEDRGRLDGRVRTEDHLTILAQWIAAIELWPVLRGLLLRKQVEAWSSILGGRDGADNPARDPELTQLLEQEGAHDWIRRTFGSARGTRLADFRAADQRLRRWGL